MRSAQVRTGLWTSGGRATGAPGADDATAGGGVSREVVSGVGAFGDVVVSGVASAAGRR
ncbi:hypothetical protein [Prauserella aidingensis]|uniref:hypothetical protein n=1 Tax=Prauserella aidingensis TaxID=387890 RepID=UPI0020A41221|nr:hypothetical protein [Prauserella aidingensis]